MVELGLRVLRTQVTIAELAFAEPSNRDLSAAWQITSPHGES